MKRTLFITKAPFDFKALTTFGVNVKPNTKNPIGQFGTGLKYAMAVLARHEITCYVVNNGLAYKLTTSDSEFRGSPISVVALESSSDHKITLPFTTDLGKHWELWMAFRELYSNTMDEQGKCIIVDESELVSLAKDEVCISVVSDAFAEIVENKAEYFIETGDGEQIEASNIEVFPGTTNSTFFRGIRVFDFEKPLLRRYNIKGSLELTEDRTAKNPYMISYEIEQAARFAKEDQREWIAELVRADSSTMEGGIYWGIIQKDSVLWDEVMKAYKEGTLVNSSLLSQAAEYEESLRDKEVNSISVNLEFFMCGEELPPAEEVLDEIKEFLEDKYTVETVIINIV